MFKQLVAVGALVMAASAGLVAGAPGQAPRPSQPAAPAAARDEQGQARYRIFMMEGVLERAVAHGADQLRRQVQRVAPDLQLLTGEAQARGFLLDGYGVFFDVAVPVMRQSVLWTWRTMFYDNGPSAGSTLQQLKASIDRIAMDPREKASLIQILKRFEMQVGAPAGTGASPALAAAPRADDRAVAANERTVQALEAPQRDTPASLAPEEAALLEDPNGAYEREVIDALIDAMLTHSGSITIGADEWLTVAAHDNEHRSRLAGQPYDLLTIVLRVKGSDLAALRAERITREEARKRVEVREY